MKMSIELKPCPFCGGEAEIERYGDHSRSTIYACTNCGCRLETGEEGDFGTDWNRRAALIGGRRKE
jgi:Lar family restriction alleviation protein